LLETIESTLHQLIWFQSSKYCFCFWNQFTSLFQSAEIAPWKLKLPPKSGKSQKIAPWEAISPHVEDHCFFLIFYDCNWQQAEA